MPVRMIGGARLQTVGKAAGESSYFRPEAGMNSPTTELQQNEEIDATSDFSDNLK